MLNGTRPRQAIGWSDPQPFLHDRARRGVLQELAFMRKQVVLDSERGQCGFVKAAQNQFLLSGIRVDVADREDSRHAGLEILGMHLECLLFELEAPFGDRTQFRVQSKECQHLIGRQPQRASIVGLYADTGQFVVVAMQRDRVTFYQLHLAGGHQFAHARDGCRCRPKFRAPMHQPQ